MSLVYGDTQASLINRERFLRNLKIDYRDLVCARQIHSARVECVKETDKTRGALSYDSSLPDTDAFVTDKRRLPLAVFTADCLSVFLYDAITPAAGLVHAGWRGTKENIVIRAVQLMQRKFNTKSLNICAGFGPGIRSCCYEVGGEFQSFFASGAIKRNGRYYLDLAGINKRQLREAGIRGANIFDSRICTCCFNKDFFSYRREGEACGRMMSVIMLT